MSTFKDWLKNNHRDLYDQVTKTVNYLSTPANRVRMGLGENTPFGVYYDGKFMPLFSDYLQKYVDWADEPNRTPAITARFELAEKALKPEYRQVYNAFFKTNPLASDDDLLEMGFPKRPSGERHPSPKPDKHPGCGIDTSEFRQVKIDYYEVDGTHKKAKPDGVHGVEARSAVFDTPREVHISDLTNSLFDTRTPLVLEFADEDRGKTLYFALRWENTRGEKGPFGPILSAVIP
jgi:hypothetical protein